MNSANDWQVKVDLRGSLKIPSDIIITNLRPDMILESTQQLGIIEVTVLSEHRIEVSNEMKKAKYAPIVEEAKEKGWRVRIWAVEVGCRGFPARSVINGRTAKRPGIYSQREERSFEEDWRGGRISQ